MLDYLTALRESMSQQLQTTQAKCNPAAFVTFTWVHASAPSSRAAMHDSFTLDIYINFIKVSQHFHLPFTTILCKLHEYFTSMNAP